MKSVNVADLKDNLSAYLNRVVQGEEVVIRNRKKPIAKIVPFTSEDSDAEDLALAAEGKLRLPEKRMTERAWKSFWSMPAPRVPLKKIVRAVLKDRDEG